MDIILTVLARGPLRWGQGRSGYEWDIFHSHLPFNLGVAAYGYGFMLSSFLLLLVAALRRAGTLSDWRMQPVKRFTYSWISLAAGMPFM